MVSEKVKCQNDHEDLITEELVLPWHEAVSTCAPTGYSPRMERSTTITTALGEVRLRVCAQSRQGGQVRTELTVANLPPDLPPGMKVESLRVVVLSATSSTGFLKLGFQVHLEANVEAYSETGEHLNARSWEENGRLVTIGTEDGEALSGRLPWLASGEEPFNIVEHQVDGLCVSLGTIPPNTPLSLHFAIAENPCPEPQECSAWFAVEIPHHRVLQLQQEQSRSNA